MSKDKKEATVQFQDLIKALVSVGLDTEVRPGENNTLLLFVREASKDHLNGEVYRSRYYCSLL
jgi:anoctamin-10